MRVFGRKLLMKKKILSVILLLSIGFSSMLISCSQASDDCYVIGSIHPITGSMAESGQALVNAQQIAIDEINAGGGINGKMLSLSVIDSGGSASGASSAARKLISDGAVALTGAYTSSSAQAVSQEAERGKTPFVVTVAASSDLLSRGYEYTFRIQPSVTTFSSNFITYFNDCVKDAYGGELKTAALIYEDSNYGAGIASYIKEHIDETGLVLVGDIPYSASSATLSTEVTKLEKIAPDILIPIGYKNDQTILVNEILSRGLTFKCVLGVANGAISDPDFIATYGSRVEGYIDINYRYNERSERAAALMEAYREKYGKELPVAAIYGYESIMVIADALRRCEDVSPENLRKAISETSTDNHILPQALIEFEENGEGRYSSGVMIQLQGGKPVVVYPAEYANESSSLIIPEGEK